MGVSHAKVQIRPVRVRGRSAAAGLAIFFFLDMYSLPLPLLSLKRENG